MRMEDKVRLLRDTADELKEFLARNQFVFDENGIFKDLASFHP